MAAKRQRLAQRRKAVGLSQEALASLLDVERSTVVRWEGGGNEPLPWIRPKLARALRVSVEQLAELLGTEPEQVAPTVPDTALSPAVSGASEPLLVAGDAGAAPSVCQLPPAVADFTGREPQIAQLADVLSSHDANPLGVPIAVISGLPGAGKTTLAVQVAHAMRPAFPDGQLWIPLEGASGHPRDPADVLGELLRALGVPGSAIPVSTAGRASLYRSRLAGRRVLVLADDAASAGQVQPLLPGTGQCAVLITSRSELAVSPGSRLVPLEPLTRAEAVELLTRVVGERRISAEPWAAEELSAACGQLPLAVRIAGARLAARTSWQLSAFTRKITETRHRLDELQIGDLSVRASLTQSYDTLDDTSRRAFRLLVLLDSAEFTEWQVACMLGASHNADVVNRLADSSLLTATGIDAAGQPRYRCHDLLRDYAAERLTDEPVTQQDAALARLTSGWLQLAALADAGLPREPYFPKPRPPSPRGIVPESLARTVTAEPMAWFTAERPGLLAAIERCCASGMYQAAAQLASSMASFQHLQGRLDDAEKTWRMIAVAAEEACDPAATAQARLRLAVATCNQGRHAEASPIVDQCVTVLGQLADKRGLGAALYWRAVCHFNLESHADAGASAERAMQIAQDVRDRPIESLALRLLALAQSFLPGHIQQSVASAERALALARQLGEPLFEQEILHSVAHVYNRADRYEDSLHLCQEGQTLAQSLPTQVATADWLGMSGDAYYGLGRYHESIEALRAALPVFRDSFMRRHHALCLLKLGYAYQAIGDYSAAIDHLEESLSIFGQLQLYHFADRARETLDACLSSQRSSPGPRQGAREARGRHVVEQTQSAGQRAHQL
jgi:tetratricopeptide (TPR) repeat protein/DNA-binding XRE family transcriptional regulator